MWDTVRTIVPAQAAGVHRVRDGREQFSFLGSAAGCMSVEAYYRGV